MSHSKINLGNCIIKSKQKGSFPQIFFKNKIEIKVLLSAMRITSQRIRFDCMNSSPFRINSLCFEMSFSSQSSRAMRVLSLACRSVLI